MQRKLELAPQPLLTEIGIALASGESVSLGDYGIFIPRNRPSRSNEQNPCVDIRTAGYQPENRSIQAGKEFSEADQ